MVCRATWFDFGNSVWIATAGKEFERISVTGGWCLSDNVIGIEGEVFLDECAFWMVKVEDSIDPLSLGIYLEFEQSQEVMMRCLEIHLDGKVVQVNSNSNKYCLQLYTP